ncbi:MAG TPA: pseudouridine synthase [Myxococcales bacterium]|nr:pseudouridine synthase [Myxococcales bacterium]
MVLLGGRCPMDKAFRSASFSAIAPSTDGVVMDLNLLLMSLGLVLATMYVIKYACDSFEGASDYLGTKVYKMAPGVRGASIEAAASSLPEFFTTLFLLFVYHDQDGFSAGIATCAGSAIFNAAVIPAVCILAVTIKGVKGVQISQLALGKSTLVRDAFFFVMAELLFIYFLGFTALAWWMGVVLMVGYGIYAAVLMRGLGGSDDVEEEEEEEEEDGAEAPGFFKALITFDFNHLLFGGQEFNARRAWIVLSSATLVIAVACYFLAEAVMWSAQALRVPAFFTAVILGAAASSVPDTIISYKNALKGDYDDAVSNAFGSNVFDICFALGLPLALYGLIYGDVPLKAPESGAGIVELCIALLVLSLIVLATFLVAKTGEDERGRKVVYAGMGRGIILVVIYGAWTTYVVGRAMEWPWLSRLVS